MAVRLTDRDLRMLAKTAVCRWLATEQIKDLYFAEATLNAVQKRLRKLSEAGYLRSFREHPTAEAIHALGPKGKPLLAGKGIEAELQSAVPGQLRHLLGINGIRIAVERSARPISFFFAYWQLADLGWRHAVIPDAVFALRAPERRTFLVEYDRGTETLDVLVRKIGSYNDGLEGFAFAAVLIFTERTRRLDLLARELARREIRVPVMAAALEETDRTDFFESVFLDVGTGGKRRILDPGEEA